MTQTVCSPQIGAETETLANLIIPPDSFYPLGSIVRMHGEAAACPAKVIEHQALGEHFAAIYHLLDWGPLDSEHPYHSCMWVSGRGIDSLEKPTARLYLPTPYGYVDTYDGTHKPDLSPTDWLMQPVEHTLECLADTYEVALLRGDYLARWPTHCPACHGMGGSWNAILDGMGSLDGKFQVCDLCSGAELCPRCGSSIPDYYHFLGFNTPCPTCGWTWSAQLAPGMALPVPPLCDCAEHAERSKLSTEAWFATFLPINKEPRL